MKISLDEIKEAARDARIELTREEERDLQTQALHIWEQISSFPDEKLAGVQGTYYVSKHQNTLRDDLLKPSLPQQIALQNAPDTEETCFRVPRIIEE